MEQRVSKSHFKARALEYLRQVEQGLTLIVTDRGRPVARITPCDSPEERLAWLRTSVVSYDEPLEPVGVEDWESLA